MKEEIVTFETAKLAKEKGYIPDKFNESVREMYGWTNVNYCDDDSKVELLTFPPNYEHHSDIPAPTQSLLQRWLRERHNQIHVNVYVSPHPYGHQYSIKITKKDVNSPLVELKFSKLGIWKETYEEALEAGLQEALKLI